MNWLLVTAADLLRNFDVNTVKLVVVVLALTVALRVLIKTFAKQTPSVRRDLIEIARIYFNRKKK